MVEKEMNNKENKKKLLLTISLVLILIIAVVGISYAAWNYVFNGTLTNTISTPEVSIELLESNDNIINITNALPMSDNQGKAQTQVFDFVVTSKTTRDMDIDYTINIEKLSVDSGYTTLSDNQIKVYLTDNNNTQKVAPTLISNLSNYKLYKGTHSHDSTHNKVQDKFKLRVWIDQDVDASSWNASTKLQYKFKIGVNGEEKDPNAYPEVVYRYSTNTVKIGDSLESKLAYCDVEISSGTQYDCFETEALCQAFLEENNYTETDKCELGTTGFSYTEDYTTLNKNFFLKHNISSEGTVESSEVCFIKDSNLYCLKAGMGSNPTYDTEYDQYITEYYKENKQTLLDAFEESDCGEECDTETGECRAYYGQTSGLSAVAFTYGDVYARDDSSSCYVHDNGYSGCNE